MQAGVRVGPHPLSSPARTLGALHQNGRVPVFASDGRNVTAAALSTLGGNSVWIEELALSPAKLPAAGAWGWAGWPVGLAGVSLCLSVSVPTFLPLQSPPHSLSFSCAPCSHPLVFLGSICSYPYACLAQGWQGEMTGGGRTHL